MPESSALNIVFLIVTAAVAYHGLTFRTEEGDSETVHLLFGCIALMFFFLVLFGDVIDLW